MLMNALKRGGTQSLCMWACSMRCSSNEGRVACPLGTVKEPGARPALPEQLAAPCRPRLQGAPRSRAFECCRRAACHSSYYLWAQACGHTDRTKVDLVNISEVLVAGQFLASLFAQSRAGAEGRFTRDGWAS